MSFVPRSPLDDLEARLEEAVALMDRCREPYWSRRLSMALVQVRANRLAGVSQVLGTFGGEGTLSDLEVLADERERDPRRHALENRRLQTLRDSLFRLADGISNATARS